MSVIHNSWALDGCSSALSDGTARCSTVRSIAYSTHARASTASPIHSRRPACGGASAAVTSSLWSVGAMRAPLLRVACAGWLVAAGSGPGARVGGHGKAPSQPVAGAVRAISGLRLELVGSHGRFYGQAVTARPGGPAQRQLRAPGGGTLEMVAAGDRHHRHQRGPRAETRQTAMPGPRPLKSRRLPVDGRGAVVVAMGPS